MKWEHFTVGSVIAFAAGWFLFGLGGAVLLAILVCLVMGILTID